MKELGGDDPAAIRRAGAIDLPLLQRYLNFWFSSSLDLFGSEVSSNAASSFANGIKGRPDEALYEDHRGLDQNFELAVPDGEAGVAVEQVPLRNAMNEVARLAYVKDCEMGLKRWNMMIRRAGHEFQLALPAVRFRRTIGSWANVATDPAGTRITAAEFERNIGGWLPSTEDRAYVQSLMQRVVEPGRMAAWLAPPERGINNKPVAYEYVRL
jgi:benzoyl-CoA 2,3-dioxygenase component B